MKGDEALARNAALLLLVTGAGSSDCNKQTHRVMTSRHHYVMFPITYMYVDTC